MSENGTKSKLVEMVKARAAQGTEMSPPNEPIDSGKQSKGPGPTPPDIRSGKELMGKVIPPILFIIEGILTEGLALLAGKSKLGKSWLALHLCLCVALGRKCLGSFDVVKGRTLYLALEDSEGRLQSRIDTLLEDDKLNEDFHYCLKFPAMNEIGLGFLRKWLEEHPDMKVVVIDMLQKVRPSQNKRSECSYGDDYNFMSGIQDLAMEFHVCILLVHHTRKQESSDPFEMISGTTGLMGCADTIWVLQRDRKDSSANLHVSGRDIDEESYSLEFDGGRWMCTGEDGGYSARLRRCALEWIEQNGGQCKARDLLRAQKKFFPSTGSVEQFLDQLVEQVLGIWVDQDPGPKGGRPTRVFVLNRCQNPPMPKPPNLSEADVSSPEAVTKPLFPEEKKVLSHGGFDTQIDGVEFVEDEEQRRTDS